MLLSFLPVDVLDLKGGRSGRPSEREIPRELV